MPDRRPPTRTEVQRALVRNALTRPAAILAGAGLAGAAIATGGLWLLVIAVVAYLGLALLTYADEDEGRRVADRAYGRAHGRIATGADPGSLTPAIRAQLDAARAQQAQITWAIVESDLSYADVRDEVALFVIALEGAAVRAQRLHAHLGAHDRAALRTRIAELERSGDRATAAALRAQDAELERLAAMLGAAGAEMEQVNAALATVHARLVALAVARQAGGQAELVGDVRELRERVAVLTDGLPDAAGARRTPPRPSSHTGPPWP